MANIRLRGAACAALIALVSTTAVQAQSAPPVASAAATVWALRAGLNVAALGCRGPDEIAIVAGYNRLLADHRAELAEAYQAVARQHGTAAAMDEAMTRLYNDFAQPAAQAALCENALGVLDTAIAEPQPLAVFARGALARLERRGSGAMTQVAAVSIPALIDTRSVDVEDGIPDEE